MRNIGFCDFQTLIIIICSCSNFLCALDMGKYGRFDFLPWNVNVWPKTGQSWWRHTLRLSLVFSDFNFRCFLRKLSVHPVERSPLTNSAWNWNLKSLTRPQHSHCAIIDFGWFWARYLHFHREKSNFPYFSMPMGSPFLSVNTTVKLLEVFCGKDLKRPCFSED